MNPTLHQALSRYAARSQILVATDFDGVLAPLVQDPSASSPVAGSIEILHELAALANVFVAIVSGRDLATLRRLTSISATDSITLIGSHGAEHHDDLPIEVDLDNTARERLAAVTEAVEQIVAGHAGTRIERKPTGIALHTRGVAKSVALTATAAARAVELPGVHAIIGKQVVELSVLSVTKGIALQALSAKRVTAATCYIGDDVTDEKAFAVLPARDGHVTVKVGPGETRATYRINGPKQVVAIFEHIKHVRSS